MTENNLSILIVIFSVQLQQTEISERKLFIFHLSQPLAKKYADKAAKVALLFL